MSQTISSRGVVIDLNAVQAKHANDIAVVVGQKNSPIPNMNARGDIIDANGKVIQPVAARVSQHNNQQVRGERGTGASIITPDNPKEDLGDPYDDSELFVAPPAEPESQADQPLEAPVVEQPKQKRISK